MNTVFFRSRSILWICLFIFICNPLSAAIIHAPHLDVLEKQISHLDENALVVFDVDCTLIIPNDRILAPCGKKHLEKFVKKHQNLPQDRQELMKSIVISGKASLVEKDIVRILTQLKQRKIKTIALTAIPPGKLGVIPNVEEWRVNQLASFGIDFSWSFPELDAFRLDCFNGKPPAFKQGILFSGNHSKGSVLCAFLDTIHWKPSNVFFIDDRLSYIHSVENELAKENIAHTSFHYTAALDQPNKLNKKLANFQLENLLQKGTWLSDEMVIRLKDEQKNKPDHGRH